MKIVEGGSGEPASKVASIAENPIRVVQLATVGTMMVQSVFGLFAFIFILTQTTVLNAYTIAIVYTTLMGAGFVFLVGLAMVKRRLLMPYQEAVWTFLTYYTVMYIIIVTWMWEWRHINGLNPAPTIGTVPFMPYLDLQVTIVLATVFFIMYGWSVWSATAESASIKTIQGLAATFANWTIALQVFGVITFVVGILNGIWSYLFVIGYDMGSLWVPLSFFIVYSAAFIAQVVCYLYIGYYRNRPTGGVLNVLESVFTMHWDEMDMCEMFLFIAWVVNFGYWIELWVTPGVQYDQFPHFTPPTLPAHYYTVVGSSIINAITTPLFVYFFVTFLCYTSDIIEDNTAKQSVMRVGTSSIFTPWGAVSYVMQYFIQPAAQTIADATTATAEATEAPLIAALRGRPQEITSGLSNWVIYVLRLIFFLGLLYQLIAAGFVLNDLLQHHYLNSRFQAWELSVIITQSVLAGLLFLYVIITWSRNSAVFSGGELVSRNAINACMYGRPLFTLVFVVFLQTFAYGKIYHKYHVAGEKIPAAIADLPTNHLNTIYWGNLMIQLGLAFAGILAMKDALLSLMVVNFKVNNAGLFKFTPTSQAGKTFAATSGTELS